MQTENTDQTAKDRKDQIFKAIAHIAARARKVEKVKLAKPGTSLSGLLRSIKAPEKQGGNRVLVVDRVGRDLAAPASSSPDSAYAL